MRGFPGSVNIRKYFFILFFNFAIGLFLYFPAFSIAKEPTNSYIAIPGGFSSESQSAHEPLNEDSGSAEIFTLERTIESAIKANIRLKASREGTKASSFAKKNQRTYFFPTLNSTYQYKYNDEEHRHQLLGVINPQDEYTFAVSFHEFSYIENIHVIVQVF